LKIIFLLLLIGLGFIGYISENTVHSIVYFSPPLKQIASGTAPENVTCTEGLQIIIKKSSGMPACVKPDSVAALIERGWGIHVLPDYIKDENNNSEIFDDGSYSITTENVNYSGDFVGFLAQPEAPGSYPGIVMIHEWWGLNDNIKQMAKHLASHGYIVLAIDLYGKEPATTTDEARQLMSSYDLEGGVTNMNNAANFLLENYQVNNLGSIGWCFGGGQSLNLALNNNNLNATVIYYGQLTTDESQLSSIKWPVLGIFAGLDQGIPVGTVNEFEISLNNLGIENEIYIYPGVNHAFANPSGMSYAPEETKDAWEKTIIFLEEHLK
jgi:carboxymethylenebutenolidase